MRTGSPKIRWAVAGMGLQGSRLAAAIPRSRYSILAATASEREYGSFARVLKDKKIDAIAIATPNNKHAAQVIAAAQAHKHILCEKPLALSVREARAIHRAVQKSGKRFFVNYHLRMHPEAQRAKRLIVQKKLGDITYIEMQWSIGGLAQKKLPPLPRHMRWREDPKKAGGGALMARGVHLFDLLRFITGKEVDEVCGWSDATRTNVDRTMVAVFELTGGTPAVITTSKSIPGADNHVTIYGTAAKLTLRDLFSADPQKMYTDVFGSFADAIRGKKTLLATIEDGIAVMRMVELFKKSTQQKRAAVLD